MDFLLTRRAANPFVLFFWFLVATADSSLVRFPSSFHHLCFCSCCSSFWHLREKNAVFLCFPCWQDLLCYYKMDDIIQPLFSLIHLPPFFPPSSHFSHVCCYVTELKQSGWSGEPLLCTERERERKMTSPFPNVDHSCCLSLSESEDTHSTQASPHFLCWNQNDVKWTFPNSKSALLPDMLYMHNVQQKWNSFQLTKLLTFKERMPSVCFTFDAWMCFVHEKLIKRFLLTTFCCFYTYTLGIKEPYGVFQLVLMSYNTIHGVGMQLSK